MSDHLDFDLAPREQRVTLDGQPYAIREAPVGVGAAYRYQVMNTAHVGDDGKVVMGGGVAEGEVRLLVGCLFRVVETPGGTTYVQAPEAFTRGLPDRVAQPLIAVAKRLSNIDQPRREPPKPAALTQWDPAAHEAPPGANGHAPAPAGDPAKNWPAATPGASG